MIRRRLPVPALLAVLLALGARRLRREEGDDRRRRPPSASTSSSTTCPTPTTPGIYAAIEDGEFKQATLDVKLRTPSDPSAPLKLLASGKADLAISYEPELLLARAKGAELVSIGALVQKPLTSIISLGRKPDPPPGRSWRARRSAPPASPTRTPTSRRSSSRPAPTPTRVKPINVGFNLVPALLTKRVDAVLGMFWNVEGVELRAPARRPVILRMDEIGVPTYNELVVVARAQPTCARAGRCCGASCARSRAATSGCARTSTRASTRS